MHLTNSSVVYHRNITSRHSWLYVKYPWFMLALVLFFFSFSLTMAFHGNSKTCGSQRSKLNVISKIPMIHRMLSWKPSFQTLSWIMAHHPTLCRGTIHLSPHQSMWSVNCSDNKNTESVSWCCFSWTNGKSCLSCLDSCLYITKMWDQMGFVSLRKVEFPLSSETHVNIKRRYEVFQLHNKKDYIMPDSFPSHISHSKSKFLNERQQSSADR